MKYSSTALTTTALLAGIICSHFSSAIPPEEGNLRGAEVDSGAGALLGGEGDVEMRLEDGYGPEALLGEEGDAGRFLNGKGKGSKGDGKGKGGGKGSGKGSKGDGKGKGSRRD